MANKESELTTAIMQYAIRCLSEGDQAALRNMNFGPREVEALREMNLGDMCHIETLRAHCLKIALNREAYWPMIAHMRNRREAGDLQKRDDQGGCSAGHDATLLRYGLAGVRAITPHAGGGIHQRAST